MPESPSRIGARAELEVASALSRAGWDVFIPMFASDSRVDLVAIRADATIRVQCKTARLMGDVLFFRTCSNTGNAPRDYLGEVDAFGVYAPDLGAAYLLPIGGLGERGCQLRLRPTSNNQAKGVRYAADYLIGPLVPGEAVGTGSELSRCRYSPPP